MGRFALFELGSTQNLHVKKSSQKTRNYDVMNYTLRRVYREVMEQGSKWRLIRLLKQ